MELLRPVEDFLRDHLTRNSIDIVPISIAHVGAVARMPHYHRDPFDRLIVAQALTDGMTLVSNEAIFDRYGIKRL